MKIFIFCGDRWGSGMYRGIYLKREFDKLGVPSVFSYCLPIYDIAQAFDVLYIIRPPLEVFGELGGWHELKRLGVPIVMDADDAFFDVPENHPGAQTLNRLDVRRAYASVFQMADLLTTTTEFNVDYFRPYVRPGVPIRVIPNAFDPDFKMFRPLHGWNPVKADGGRLVGWTGGSQHAWDLERLMPVFRALSARKDHVMFLGDLPPSVVGIPRTHAAPGTPNAEYYLQTPALLGFDAGLGPLQDTLFNAVKSPLKIVEYLWLAGCPAVVSDLPCFSEIPEGTYGRVFKVKGFDPADWLAAIDKALEVIQNDGRQYFLPARYNLKNTIRQWYDAFLACYRLVREDDPGGQYPSFHETKKDIILNGLQLVGQTAARLMGRA